jgi:hypothetical protein
MRLREYDRRHLTTTGLGHHLWMRDDVAVTVLADALDQPDLPRAAVFGRIGADAFCVVVADDGRLEYLLDRGTTAGGLDLDLMRRDLGVLARHALERLVDDPADRLWNGLFRAAVWAATTPLCTTFTTGTRHVAAFDCADALPGGPVPRPLAAQVPGDRDLTEAIARAIADPDTRDHLDELLPATRTAAAVTASLVGLNVEADVIIDQLAVTGVWPPGIGTPVHEAPLWWNNLDWYLLPVPRRRRGARGIRRA